MRTVMGQVVCATEANFHFGLIAIIIILLLWSMALNYKLFFTDRSRGGINALHTQCINNVIENIMLF